MKLTIGAKLYIIVLTMFVANTVVFLLFQLTALKAAFQSLLFQLMVMQKSDLLLLKSLLKADLIFTLQPSVRTHLKMYSIL